MDVKPSTSHRTHLHTSYLTRIPDNTWAQEHFGNQREVNDCEHHTGVVLFTIEVEDRGTELG